MKAIHYLLSVLLLAGTALLAQDSSHQTQIRDIYDTALTSGKSYAWLEHLSNQIGGRLSGSLEAERAVSWGEEELKALALDAVRLQSVMVPKWCVATLNMPTLKPAQETPSMFLFVPLVDL